MNRDVFSARAIYATAPYYESLLPFWRYYQKPINSTAHGYQYIFRPETDFNKKKRKSRNDWCHDPTTYRKSFKKVTCPFNNLNLWTTELTGSTDSFLTCHYVGLQIVQQKTFICFKRMKTICHIVICMAATFRPVYLRIEDVFR